MKTIFAVCAAAVGFAGLLNAADSGGESDLPQPLPAARYDKLARQNPFILPTAAPVTPVNIKPAPKWSDGLSAVAVMQQGAAYVATVYDRSTNERFPVSTDPDVKNNHDIALASVKWADTMADTTITLRKGNEFSPVKYEPNAGGAPPIATPVLPAGQARPPMNPATAANRLPTPVFNPPPAQQTNPNLNPNLVRRQNAIRATPSVNPAGAAMRLPANSTAPRAPAGIRPPPGSALPADDDDDE